MSSKYPSRGQRLNQQSRSQPCRTGRADIVGTVELTSLLITNSQRYPTWKNGEQKISRTLYKQFQRSFLVLPNGKGPNPRNPRNPRPFFFRWAKPYFLSTGQ